LPPRCAQCGGILRPPVVLFEAMLPEDAVGRLYDQVRQGFDLVLAVRTTARFPCIVDPVASARRPGGLTVGVNPQPTDLAPLVDVRLAGRASDVLPQLLSHISGH